MFMKLHRFWMTNSLRIFKTDGGSSVCNISQIESKIPYSSADLLLSVGDLLQRWLWLGDVLLIGDSCGIEGMVVVEDDEDEVEEELLEDEDEECREV